MKDHIIIGTAGHIDHGKTALIKALTGIDTDTLPQEKERGITIELGFAYWQDNITIIDVPGHERFIRTMVAGVNTIDLFLMVIAADDGIMPQTREHLDILRFFGVRQGIVALTKIDLVDEEWLEWITLEVRDFLDSNGFTEVPIIPVSSVKGTGIHDLRKMLEQSIQQCQVHSSERPFRLNVDRSFSIHGSGTVVTGTVLSGKVKVGDELLVLPAGKETRVRGIQVHQEPKQSAHLGQRAALNLSGLTREEIGRGDTLVAPGTLENCLEFLAVLHTVQELPLRLKRHQMVGVHAGTWERMGRITWLEKENSMQAGKTYHARVRLLKPAAVVNGDAVLIRSHSPAYTLAGGRIIQIEPPPLRKISKDYLTYFSLWQSNDLETKIENLLENNKENALELNRVARLLFEPMTRLRVTIAKMKTAGKVILHKAREREYLVSTRRINLVADKLVSELEKVDVRSSGWNRNELYGLFSRHFGNDKIFFEIFLPFLLKKGHLIFDEDRFYSRNHGAAQRRDKHRQVILDVLKEAGFQGLSSSDISCRCSLPEEEVRWLLGTMVRQGKIISLAGKYYLHRIFLEDLIIFLRRHFAEHDSLELATLKSYTNLSRKWLIPLIEYLDQQQFTRRQGDLRVPGGML